MAELAVKKDNAIARPLHALIPLIRKEIELGIAAGAEHFRKAGEYLWEAKEQVENESDDLDAWREWLADNFDFSFKTADSWMKLAGSGKRASTVRTLSQFTHPNRDPGHRPTWHEPVKAAVKTLNVERLTAEKQNKEREAKLIRELGLRLIDIGYKVLAQQLHPDKGGSRDGMARLNRVRDLLKAAL